MNTKMSGFIWFSKMFAFLCLLDGSSLSIGMVNPSAANKVTFIQSQKSKEF